MHNQIPFTLLYNNPVDYHFLKIFGCLCFASTLTSHCLKFQPRAKACVFLGYHPGIKGYKLYDIVSKNIFISRDVTFHKDIFPFHSIPHNQDIIDNFPTLVLPKPASDIPTPDLANAPVPGFFQNSDQVAIQSITPNPPLRRSLRTSKHPSYLQDFHCTLTPTSPALSHNSSSSYPLKDYLAYNKISPSHNTLLFNISSNFEPQF